MNTVTRIFSSKSLLRLARYCVVGVSTFVFDLVILTCLTKFLGMNPVYAAGVAFFLAITVNYVWSRRYVFHESLEPNHIAYTNFIIVAVVGMVLTMGGMHVLVVTWGMYYLYARTVLAGFVGIFTYVTNLYFNFKVHANDIPPAGEVVTSSVASESSS